MDVKAIVARLAAFRHLDVCSVKLANVLGLPLRTSGWQIEVHVPTGVLHPMNSHRVTHEDKQTPAGNAVPSQAHIGMLRSAA